MNQEVIKLILDNGYPLSKNTLDFLNYDTEIGSMVYERLGPDRASIACNNLMKILAQIGEERLSFIYQEKLRNL